MPIIGSERSVIVRVPETVMQVLLRSYQKYRVVEKRSPYESPVVVVQKHFAGLVYVHVANILVYLQEENGLLPENLLRNEIKTEPGTAGGCDVYRYYHFLLNLDAEIIIFRKSIV